MDAENFSSEVGDALPLVGSAIGELNEQHLPANWPMARLLSTAARSVERRWAAVLADLGLTHAGLIVLHLLELGAETQVELARLAHVEAQTMSRTVDRLERAGYVTRSPDPADRRRHMLSMTDAGHRMWQRTQGLEAQIVPAVDDPAALREALLHIIGSTS